MDKEHDEGESDFTMCKILGKELEFNSTFTGSTMHA